MVVNEEGVGVKVGVESVSELEVLKIKLCEMMARMDGPQKERTCNLLRKTRIAGRTVWGEDSR